MNRTESSGVLFGHSSARNRRRSRVARAAVESLESRRYLYEIGIDRTSGSDEGDIVGIAMDFTNAWQLPNNITIDSGIGWQYTAWPEIDFYWDGSVASGISTTNDNGTSITISWHDGLDPWTQYWNPSVNNVAPTATISNSGPVGVGGTVTVGLSNPYDPSGPDTTAGFTYAYDFNGDMDFADGNEAPSSSATRTTTFGSAGVKVIYGRIHDKDSGYTEYTTSVTVTGSTTAPTLTLAGTTSMNEGSVATLTLGAIVDPEGDTVTHYRINWGDGTSPDVKTAAEVATAGRVLTHTYTDNASNTISVDLKDADNPSTYYNAVATRTVSVANVAPSSNMFEDNTYYVNMIKNETITLAFTGVSDPAGANDTPRYHFAAAENALAATYTAATTIASTTFSCGTKGTKQVFARIYDEDGGISQTYEFRIYVYDRLAENTIQVTPMTGAELPPPTIDTSWNSDVDSNCYNYAANFHWESGGFAYPGTASDTEGTFSERVVGDGFVHIMHPWNLARAVEERYAETEDEWFADWTQFYVVNAWFNMHWFRLNSNGLWADKDGSAAPVQRPAAFYPDNQEDVETLFPTLVNPEGFYAVRSGTEVTG